MKMSLLYQLSPDIQNFSDKLSLFSAGQHHNSCMNSLAVIEYVKEHAPGMLPMLFDDLGLEMKGIQDVDAFLSDPNNWVSSSLIIKLFANAKNILGDKDAAFHIGYNSILKKRFGYLQKIFIYALGNPAHVIKKLQKINDHFNRTKIVKHISLTKTASVIRLYWDKDIPLSRDFCSYNKGIYQAIPTIWGCPPAELVETKSFFDGDDYCEYHLKWLPPSRLKTFWFNLMTPKKVVRETIIELERDKELLKEKYNHINGLNRALERKVAELTTLQESSTAILSTLKLEELLDVIVSKLMDVADLDRAGIFMANKEEQHLVLIHAVGIDEQLISRLKGYEIPLDKVDNIIARSAHSKEPVIVEDVEALSLNPENLLLKSLHPKAFILVPLNVRGEIIGIMVGDNAKNKDFVHKMDRNFLKGFANHIAMALDNARLYKQLRESEQRYREIVENVNEGIWVLDEDGAIKFANRRLVDMLGHGDLTGMNIYRLVKEEDRNLLLNIIMDNLKGRLSKKEVQLQDGTGGYKTVLLSSVPIRVEDRFSGCLAIVTDLTDKKSMEKKLLQTQKLESVGTMAGGIAHDFNNILTGILGYTTLLQLGLTGNPELKKYTDVIEKSSLRAADLVKKMLTFSRHSKPSENASTSLGTVIEDSISLLQSSLPKTIPIELNQSEDLPLIECDPTQVQQIILNLCLNARDAMPHGGSISITTGSISQTKAKQLHPELELAPSDYVRLKVTDTGEGITEEVLERIFDPFFTTKEI
ncbi:MAG: PAS domain S-box protein, partial [Desulfobulbaceae bacterium]|nr:PAS domain S-box protein [Desulfobulbaceae bacterium]